MHYHNSTHHYLPHITIPKGVPVVPRVAPAVSATPNLLNNQRQLIQNKKPQAAHQQIGNQINQPTNILPTNQPSKHSDPNTSTKTTEKHKPARMLAMEKRRGVVAQVRDTRCCRVKQAVTSGTLYIALNKIPPTPWRWGSHVVIPHGDGLKESKNAHKKPSSPGAKVG